MSTSYRLQIDIVDAEAPRDAAGLLVPVPPTTPHQHLQTITLDPRWHVMALKDKRGVQSAYFVGDAQLGTIIFNLLDRGTLDETHFAGKPDDDTCTDALLFADEIGLPKSRVETERLERIVDSLARKFQYKSGHQNDAPLTCDILTGNCLSINQAFLKMTKIADIKSAYYIGYFFEDERPLQSNDWHCWISTLTTRGFESWDIAHHLKRGLGKVQSALNPVPGIRFATCVGSDLTFGLPFADVAVPHLCEPRWVFADGSSQRCEVRVSVHAQHAELRALSEAAA